MPTNNRVFYAIQALGFKPDGVETAAGFITQDETIRGLQSIGMTTTFNLEQVFQLGQLEIFENIENLPEVELTANKVLDGYPMIYHVATSGAAGSALSTRTTNKVTAVVGVWPDVYVSASGKPDSFVVMSGLFISALNYTLPVDGNCTESITFVGNDKVWTTNTSNNPFAYEFANDMSPAAADGVQRRENVLMGVVTPNSHLPKEIPGIDGNGENPISGSTYAAHVQTITIATDLGRTDLFELGRRAPYYKFANFPVEVTCSIEVTTSEGDAVDASSTAASNLSDQLIKIELSDDTQIYLGATNKLQSVDYTGGDAGGGNVTTSFNYSGFNSLTITNPVSDSMAFSKPGSEG